MKRHLCLLTLLCLFGLILQTELEASDREVIKKELRELEQKVKPFVESFRKASELIGPSVVSINTTSKKGTKDIERRVPGFEIPEREFGPYHSFDIPQWGQGSGIIIDKRGYILTNLHVIEDYEEATITITTASGKVCEGNVVGIDSKTDLAVIKIEGDSYEPAEFGNSDEVRVGDWVIAIGNPFGYQQTVSAGIVSAVGRKGVVPFPRPFAYEDFIQTDVAINPGNSGGPLVNLRGEIIGINTAIATKTGGFQGIGFAISSNITKEVSHDLIEKGRVIRGYLGVGIRDIDDELARSLGFANERDMLTEYTLPSCEGAFVSEVWDDTPAFRGGIKPGDVIVALGIHKIINSEGLQKYTRQIPVGSLVEITIFRDRTSLTFPIKIEEQPEDLGDRKFVSVVRKGDPEEVGLGLTLQELNPEIAQSLGYHGEKGLVVTGVEVGSPADRVGIIPGDLILQLGLKPVGIPAEFRQALTEAQRNADKVALLLKGKGFILIKP